jgi:primosomal protein N' (replication factor Y)
MMKEEHFADVALPLAVKGRFSYRIPDALSDKILPGSRVIVQFGNRKFYSGIVLRVHSDKPDIENIKDITDILDPFPVVYDQELKLWEWLSEYYMCSVGEVMKAAIPSGLCLESETLIRVDPEFTDIHSLGGPAAFLFAMIENRGSVHLKNLSPVTDEKNTLKVINELVQRNAIITGESIPEKYKPREEAYIILSKKYTDSELNSILDNLSKAPKQ